MLYAAEKLVESAFTLALVNAQITLLNTALSETITDVAALLNGLSAAPRDADDFPALCYFVGQDAGKSELAFQGKRDTMVPVRLLYISRHTTMASAKTDIQVAIEALQTCLETLPGLQHSTTSRYCVNVLDPVVEFVTYKVSDEVIRHGGELRCTMLMRTEGVS